MTRGRAVAGALPDHAESSTRHGSERPLLPLQAYASGVSRSGVLGTGLVAAKRLRWIRSSVNFLVWWQESRRAISRGPQASAGLYQSSSRIAARFPAWSGLEPSGSEYSLVTPQHSKPLQDSPTGSARQTPDFMPAGRKHSSSRHSTSASSPAGCVFRITEGSITTRILPEPTPTVEQGSTETFCGDIQDLNRPMLTIDGTWKKRPFGQTPVGLRRMSPSIGTTPTCHRGGSRAGGVPRGDPFHGVARPGLGTQGLGQRPVSSHNRPPDLRTPNALCLDDFRYGDQRLAATSQTLSGGTTNRSGFADKPRDNTPVPLADVGKVGGPTCQ